MITAVLKKSGEVEEAAARKDVSSRVFQGKNNRDHVPS